MLILITWYNICRLVILLEVIHLRKAWLQPDQQQVHVLNSIDISWQKNDYIFPDKQDWFPHLLDVFVAASNDPFNPMGSGIASLTSPVSLAIPSKHEDLTQCFNVSMLGQRRRRLTNSETTSGQVLVFAGYTLTNCRFFCWFIRHMWGDQWVLFLPAIICATLSTSNQLITQLAVGSLWKEIWNYQCEMCIPKYAGFHECCTWIFSFWITSSTFWYYLIR